MKIILPIVAAALLLAGCTAPKSNPPVVSTSYLKISPGCMDETECVHHQASWLNGGFFWSSYYKTNFPPHWVVESAVNGEEEIACGALQALAWQPFKDYLIKTNGDLIEFAVLVDTNICGRAFRVRKLK